MKRLMKFTASTPARSLAQTALKGLMTGWAGDSFFVSTVTLGGLEDLGYIVDYSKAGPVNDVAAVPERSWSS
jgi:hypothetical protein